MFRRTALCILIVAIGLVAGMPVHGARPPMVAGGIGFTYGITEFHAALSVRQGEGLNGSGVLRHWNDQGVWIRVDIKYVNVGAVGDDAYFAGIVTAASNASWEGRWMLAAARDGGTPGKDGDYYWGALAPSEDLARYKVENQEKLGPAYVVSKGNLVIGR
jgi:hypothetical protein